MSLLRNLPCFIHPTVVRAAHAWTPAGHISCVQYPIEGRRYASTASAAPTAEATRASAQLACGPAKGPQRFQEGDPNALHRHGGNIPYSAAGLVMRLTRAHAGTPIRFTRERPGGLRCAEPRRQRPPAQSARRGHRSKQRRSRGRAGRWRHWMAIGAHRRFWHRRRPGWPRPPAAGSARRPCRSAASLVSVDSSS